jgi:hypothetical protein
MPEHSSIERAARLMCAPPTPAPSPRSRIEAIIYRELDYYGHNLSGHLADVLVDELGLDPSGRVPTGEAEDWDHDRWVAAWGRNATLVFSDNEVPVMPPTPPGASWLVTRALVDGRPAAELALVGPHGGQSTVLARARVEPDPDPIVAMALLLVQGMAP